MPPKVKVNRPIMWVLKPILLPPSTTTPPGTAKVTVKTISFMKYIAGNWDTLPLRDLSERQKKQIPKPQTVHVPLLLQLFSHYWVIHTPHELTARTSDDKARLLTLYASQIQQLLKLLHQEISQGLPAHVIEAHRALLQQEHSLAEMVALSKYIQGEFMRGKYHKNQFCLSFPENVAYPVVLSDAEYQTLRKGYKESMVELMSHTQYAQKMFQSLWTVVRSAVQPNMNLVVWRGYTPPKHQAFRRPGTLIPQPSFMSTSLVKAFAAFWLRGSSCCLWRLEVNPSEVPGLAIMTHLAELAFPGNEFEWLIAPCYLRVSHVEQVAWAEFITEQDRTIIQALNNTQIDYPSQLTVVHAQVIPPKSFTWNGPCLKISPPL